MENERLTIRDDWKAKSLGVINSFLFDDIFLKYLEKSQNKTCLEIGCMPAGFLAYLCKTFGYSAHGIDFSPDARRISEETLKANGINQCVFYEDDVVNWEPPMQYDLVCSFGFIEHFRGALQREIIRKHIEATKSKGRLIIEVPNFSYGQYLIHLILDRKNLRLHNTSCMKLSFFRKIAEEYDLNIVHLDYYGGIFLYWHENNDLNLIQRLINKVLGKIARRLRRTRFQGLNNRCFSPFLIFIAEKKT